LLFLYTIKGKNADADLVISNIRIRIIRLSLLGICIRILMHRVIIIRIRAIIQCDYYPLSAYEVIGILGLEVVIPA
jgi:hypothetical protein